MEMRFNDDTVRSANCYIQHIAEHRLVACRECQCAVWPQEIKSHFRGSKHNVAKERIADILGTVSTWTQLIWTKVELQVPRSVELPVEQLELYRDGFKCAIEPEGCQYVCRSEKRLLLHVKQKHDYPIWTNDIWLISFVNPKG